MAAYGADPIPPYRLEAAAAEGRCWCFPGPIDRRRETDCYTIGQQSKKRIRRSGAANSPNVLSDSIRTARETNVDGGTDTRCVYHDRFRSADTVSPEISTPEFATAVQRLEREHRELAEERRAFQRFKTRVSTLETAAPQLAGPGIRTHEPRTDGLSEVREAYVQTVASVSHYADVYGEPWLENVAGELSEELAAALDQHTQLHPPLKRSLVDAGARAVKNRDNLLDLIAAERDAVERFRGEIAEPREELQSLLDQPIDRLEFNALRITRTRVERLREQCDRLAAERQAQLRRRNARLAAADVATLGQYLYAESGVSYPILDAIADLGGDIDRALRTVDESILRAA